MRFLRTPILKNICERLLLKISISVTNLEGKHLCQGLFLNKFVGLMLWHMRFPINFVKLLRTPFLTDHLRRLLLSREQT